MSDVGSLVSFFERQLNEEQGIISESLGDGISGCVVLGRNPETNTRAKIHADAFLRLSLNERRLKKIAQIEAVLHSLKSGWDGTCTECGEEIPPARLMAVPTTLCVHCASKMQ